MSAVLLFFYVNLSAFHGDGTVVWLTPEGHAVVQRATRDESRIFSFDIPQTTIAHLRAELEKLDASKIKVADRLGIPDEVRIHIGYRDQDWHLHAYSMWEHDLGKQQAQLRRLRDIAQEIIALTAKRKPDRTDHVAPGTLAIERPAAISAAELDAAMK